MNLHFIKMHGLGNDYVYLDTFQAETAAIVAATDIPKLACRISDRHFGIGSDGLVLMMPSDGADARMRMFNADGSEAQMCGNAIRCVAKYLYESGICNRKQIQIDTLSGIRTLDLHVTDGIVEQVSVNMGQPRIMQDLLFLDGKPMSFVSVNMGNPHAVFFRSSIPEEDFLALGEQIGTHPHFPEGTNVEFVQILNDKELRMRVWERGTGETLACGTGACAAASAAIWLGKTQTDVTVHLRGGDLNIRQETGNSPVYMTGPATETFRGTYILEE